MEKAVVIRNYKKREVGHLIIPFFIVLIPVFVLRALGSVFVAGTDACFRLADDLMFYFGKEVRE